MQVTRGLTHEYLGMTLDFNVRGKVKVIMKAYVLGILSEASEYKPGTAQTPESNNLFIVDNSSPPLLTKQAQKFHIITAKLLFL